MLGPEPTGNNGYENDAETRGIIPRAIESIFAHLDTELQNVSCFS